MKDKTKDGKKKERALEKFPMIRSFLEYSNSLKDKTGVVTPVQREMIYTVVSRQNGCVFCTIGHGRKLFELTGDKKLYEDVVKDFRQAEIDPGDMLMLEYATRLNRKPETLKREQLAPLHEAGFSQEAILEIITHAAVMSAQNRIRTGLGYQISPGMQREAERLGLSESSI